MLPLVCKRWARVLGRPSDAWESIMIDLHSLHGRGDGAAALDQWPLLNARVISAWFGQCVTLHTD